MNWKMCSVNTAAFVLCLGVVCTGAQIQVPADYPTIQVAIEAAADGDAIIVAPGLYVENVETIQERAVILTSEDPTDPDTVAQTIIDGNGVKPCVTVPYGGEAVIAGFTITNGSSLMGLGGINCLGGHATVVNNMILSNLAGGVYATGATVIQNMIADNQMYGGVVSLYSAVVTDNIVAGNVSLVYTGGIDVVGASNHITGNVVSCNKGANGGGIGCSSAESLITDNTIIGNESYLGAGIWCRWGGPVIADNLIADNKAYLSDTETKASGGGIACEDSSPTIIGNVIVRNEAQWGGGIFCTGSSSKPTIMNNLIAGNKAAVMGGAIALREGAAPSFAANTMVYNRSKQYGGGVVAVKSQASLVDCILWGNSAPTGPELVLANTAEVTVKHCNIAGGQSAAFLTEGCTLAWGAGNIDADPLFVDTGRWDDAGTPGDASDDVFILGDYRLLPGSPCIDAGTNDVDNPATPDVEALPDMDLAGIARIIDGDLDGTATIDIGAYEYLPGDVNYDGKVNILDLISVRNSLGKDAASDPAARRCDVNNDGAVNVLDIIVVRNQLK